MNPTRAIRRSVGILAGIAGALLVSLAVVPAALAAPHRTTPPGPRCSSPRPCRPAGTNIHAAASPA